LKISRRARPGDHVILSSANHQRLITLALRFFGSPPLFLSRPTPTFLHSRGIKRPKAGFLSLSIVFLHWRVAPRLFLCLERGFLPRALLNIADSERYWFFFFFSFFLFCSSCFV